MNSLLSLVLLIAFANLLPKETFGIYRYILSIAGILNIFTLTGMNNAVSQATARGGDGVLRPAVTYQLRWNLLMFAASVVLGSYYFIQGDTTLAASLLILGTFVPLTLAFNTYGAFLDGKKKFGTANILGVLSTLVYSAGMIVTLLFTNNVLWLITVYALLTFLPSAIFYFYTVKKFHLEKDDDISDVTKYGWELTLLRILDPIVSQIDKLVLGSFWGAGQLATYTLALAVPNRAMLFIKGWVGIGFPKFSQKNIQELDSVFWRRIAQGVFIGFLFTIGYILFSPYLFKYILPQYIEGVFYSQILSLNFIFALPNRYISLLFTSQKQSKILFRRTLIQSLISIVLYVILGVWGGLLGLVIANLLNTCLGTYLNISLWKRFVTHT